MTPQLQYAEYIDLERAVTQLRRAAIERSKIPEHSGSISSEQRKANRAERARLKEIITEAEQDIIAWALTFIPVGDDDSDTPPTT